MSEPQGCCVILQPTFLPWLGWFDMVDQVELLVILDDVQFSKQSWQQRNRIRTRAGLELINVPIKTSGRLGQLILECEFANNSFVEKIIKTLNGNYGKAPFFRDNFAEVAEKLRSGASSGKLVDLNCTMIEWIANKLEIRTPMVRSSYLDVQGHRGDRVAALCSKVGMSHYLSPAGAEEYLAKDFMAFESRNISVDLHVYEHPDYPQLYRPFIPFATILDLIFNVGPAALEIMRSGRRESRPLVPKAFKGGA